MNLLRPVVRECEIAKGFSVFNRKNASLLRPNVREYVEYNSPISRDLHLGRMSAEKLNVLVLVVQQRDDETPCFWAFLDLKASGVVVGVGGAYADWIN